MHSHNVPVNSRAGAVTVLTAVAVAPSERANEYQNGPDGRGSGDAVVTLVGTAAAVGLWLVALVVGYAIVSYLVLFYLPSADRLPSGTAADAAFVVTLPFVLAVTWFAAIRRRG